MAHTPGPWYSWLPRDCDGGCRTIRTEKGRAHGTYYGTELASTHGLANDEEDKANARLIAAAPDLLEALESTITNDHYNECLAGQRGYGMCSPVCMKIKAALARAQGKEQ